MRMLIDIYKEPHKSIIEALRSAFMKTLYEREIEEMTGLKNITTRLRYLVRIGILRKEGRCRYSLNKDDPRLLRLNEDLRRFKQRPTHLCKPVRCTNLVTGESFICEGQTIAAEKLFGKKHHARFISECCKNKIFEYKGYRFEYA